MPTKGLMPLLNLCFLKGGPMLHHFGGFHFKAIAAMYPDIGIDEKQFLGLTLCFIVAFETSISIIGGKWQCTKQTRRNFFNQLATDLGFSPLESQRWYGVSQQDVLRKKVFH
jgi:hypothetical protein